MAHTQGPNKQSIVASGMTVEEWKKKHPNQELGPDPEEIGQETTDEPDESKVVPRTPASESAPLNADPAGVAAKPEGEEAVAGKKAASSKKAEVPA